MVKRKEVHMKKFKYILLLTSLLLSTGCVKYNASMDIKKDKSMDFSIIYALDTTYFEDTEVLDSSDKLELEQLGFTITDYNNGNMLGYTLNKSINNIDDVSITDSVNYDLSGLLTNKEDSNYIFKIKKGIIKNTYIAKFKFDSDESNLNNLEEGNTTNEEDTDSLDMSDMDLSSFTSNLDLSFNVSLPFSAISNNATTVNNDNKNLTWNLTSFQEDYIEFEFDLYNMTNIYIGISIIGLILLLIVFYILNKKKKKPLVVEDNIELLEPLETTLKENIQEIPTITPIPNPVTLSNKE
jgi:cbb3-type cytochrome oxidase subunit 3